MAATAVSTLVVQY